MDHFFQLRANGTTVSREILAGVVTFATMAYILCVQPALMSGQLLGTETGMNYQALVTTTCLASAFGCFLMGLLSRYPFALAPGMGTNFFVICELFPACAAILGLQTGCGAPEIWMLAMAVVFLSGILFFLLSMLRVRHLLLDLISPSLKMAICGGIGFFIAFLGLRNGGILTITHDQPALGSMVSWDAAIFLTGFLVSSVLLVRKVPGTILLGIFASACVAFAAGKITISQIVGLPANPLGIVGHLALGTACQHLWTLLPFIFILTFMDVFDTFGTVIGIGHQAGFMKDGKLPRIERVFAADACATMAGAVLGHSTVTTFLESAAGVESGGRTGLVSVVVGVLFLAALFFSPLLIAIGSCPPVTASALVLVGILMTRSLKSIEWDDLTEVIPAFLIMIGIPFFNSIANGILCGLVVYPFLKLLTGRVRETTPGMFVLALILTAYLIFVR